MKSALIFGILTLMSSVSISALASPLKLPVSIAVGRYEGSTTSYTRLGGGQSYTAYRYGVVASCFDEDKLELAQLISSDQNLSVLRSSALAAINKKSIQFKAGLLMDQISPVVSQLRLLIFKKIDLNDNVKYFIQTIALQNGKSISNYITETEYVDSYGNPSSKSYYFDDAVLAPLPKNYSLDSFTSENVPDVTGVEQIILKQLNDLIQSNPQMDGDIN